MLGQGQVTSCPTPEPLPRPRYLGKDLSAAEMVVLIRENLRKFPESGQRFPGETGVGAGVGGWEGPSGDALGKRSRPSAPLPPFLAHLLRAPQLLLSRYMGLDCRADRMARREEKFRSSRQRWGVGWGRWSDPEPDAQV